MLNLRMVKGPLTRIQSETILDQYNRSSSARIPIQEFIHWVQSGPAGPALHAILETDDGEIVGHHALIPLAWGNHHERSIPAKSEYTFIKEGFQTAKIKGLEKIRKPTWLVMLEQHLRHGCENGFGPILISTRAALHRFVASIGSQRLEIPVRECLLVLRPWNAALETPNLQTWQKASLCAAGIFQRIVWLTAPVLSARFPPIPSIPIDSCSLPSRNGAVEFFEDPPFLQWRYLPGQYEKLALDAEGRNYVLAKKGSPDRYVRVCQWRLGIGQPSFALLSKLVQMANEERALGVRWAFYGGGEEARQSANRMRRFGFLCARRMRTLLIYPKDQIAVAEKWRLTDSMFSFDP